MVNYDHTFTENLINVVRDDEQGLYQARPKTSFDTVVAQKNDSQEAAAEYGGTINVLYRDLEKYGTVSQTPEEYARLSQKCETLLKDFDEEYKALTKVAREVVTEYLNETNKSFITASISKKSIFSTSLLLKIGITFSMGAAAMFMLIVLCSSLADSIVLKRKYKLVEEIKQSDNDKGAW